MLSPIRGVIKPNEDRPCGTRSGTMSSFSCLSLFRNAAIGAVEERRVISGLTTRSLSLDDKLIVSRLLTAALVNLWCFIMVCIENLNLNVGCMGSNITNRSLV